MITYRLLSLLFTSSLALSACRPSFMAEQRPPGPKVPAPAQRLDPSERSCSVTVAPQGASTFLLLSNPFSRGGNTVGEVLPSVPVGSRVYKYVDGNYQISTLDEFSDPPTWTNSAMVINPGDGFWLEVPSTAGTALTVEFRGLAPDSVTEVSRH